MSGKGLPELASQTPSTVYYGQPMLELTVRYGAITCVDACRV